MTEATPIPDALTLACLASVYAELIEDGPIDSEDLCNHLAVVIECEEGWRPGVALAMAENWVAAQ